jgi:TonB family protein
MAGAEYKLRAITTRQPPEQKAVTQRLTSVGTFFASALLSFAITFSVLAQSTKWKEHISEKGKFSVLLPGAPETDYRLGETDSITGLVYEVNYRQEDVRLWSVNYFDLLTMPSDAGGVTKVLEQRRDKYSAGSESTMLTLNGFPALEYKKRIDRDGIEIGRIVLVRQRLYELRMFTLTRANQAASEEVTKFFDSFIPVPMTDEEIVAATRVTWKKATSRTLVASGLLVQKRAVKKVQPVCPPEAKAARVSGPVKIRILISEEGNVIDAEVLDGHDLLRESALAAARLWVFMPTHLAGAPVKVESILTLKFASR